MDYKEKLRLAKEALNSGSYDKETIEYIFPELKENDDEKIRKFISHELACLRATDEKGSDRYEELTNAIAWLEKQGEQKPKFRVGDTIKCKHDDRIFTIKSIDLDKGTYTYTQEGCGNDIDYADEMFELVEQKPAWSEEDEEMVNNIVDYMRPMPIFFESTIGESGKKYTQEFIEGAIVWLKSLKERMKGE